MSCQSAPGCRHCTCHPSVPSSAPVTHQCPSVYLLPLS
ncbi:unnamed protein product, partial [Staurois parvus]